MQTNNLRKFDFFKKQNKIDNRKSHKWIYYEVLNVQIVLSYRRPSKFLEKVNLYFKSKLCSYLKMKKKRERAF